MTFKDRIDAAIANPHKCDCEKATLVDLDALDALHAKATPGPWVESGEFHISAQSVEFIRVYGAHNRDFVRHIRNAYPAMSAELRRLREQVANMNTDAK